MPIPYGSAVTGRTRARSPAPAAIAPALEAGSQLSLFAPVEAVTFRHSRRARRLTLRVFPHGVVEVVIPPRTARRRVEEFLHAHAGWIARARQALLGAHASPAVDPPARVHLPAVGERWRVVYRPGAGRLTEHSSATGRHLLLEGPADDQWRRTRLRTWLRDRGREVLIPWLGEVSAELGLTFADAAVRRQRSRWGSCSAERRISLNCALLFVEPELVRYLFIHELCHTRHLNHSRSFWRLVARFEPAYEAREAALSQAWRFVPAWVSYDPPGA